MSAKVRGAERIPKHFLRLLGLMGPGAVCVRLAFRCSVSGSTLPFSVVQSPLLRRNSCWPTRLSRETAYMSLELSSAAVGEQPNCAWRQSLQWQQQFLNVSVSLVVQSITPTVKSCSWAWPTSTPSGTVSSICELSAVKCQTPASKSPCSSYGGSAHSA